MPYGLLIGCQIGQAIVYFNLVCLIDYLKINSFKGTDGNLKTVDRLQMPEDQDVKDMKNTTQNVWNDAEYLIKSREL